MQFWISILLLCYPANIDVHVRTINELVFLIGFKEGGQTLRVPEQALELYGWLICYFQVLSPCRVKVLHKWITDKGEKPNQFIALRIDNTFPFIPT